MAGVFLRQPNVLKLLHLTAVLSGCRTPPSLRSLPRNLRSNDTAMPDAREVLAQLLSPPPRGPPLSMPLPPTPMGQHPTNPRSSRTFGSIGCTIVCRCRASCFEVERAITENREAGNPIRQKNDTGDKCSPVCGLHPSPNVPSYSIFRCMLTCAVLWNSFFTLFARDNLTPHKFKGQPSQSGAHLLRYPLPSLFWRDSKTARCSADQSRREQHTHQIQGTSSCQRLFTTSWNPYR